MGLWSSENSPCLFTGIIIPGEPLIYVGIYVDDIIYFSTSNSWVRHSDGNLSVSLSQQSFTETLMESLNIDRPQFSTFLTPYRSGQSIDSVPSVPMLPAAKNEL